MKRNKRNNKYKRFDGTFENYLYKSKDKQWSYKSNRKNYHNRNKRGRIRIKSIIKNNNRNQKINQYDEKLDEFLRMVRKVNGNFDDIFGAPSLFLRKSASEEDLFPWDEGYLFCWIEEKGYHLPVLYCDKWNALSIKLREGFMYPFTVFKNRNNYEISVKDIYKPGVSECIGSDDFCKVTSNRALFFAGIVWKELNKFKKPGEAAQFIQRNKHYQKLFECGCNDKMFTNEAIRMINTELFSDKGEVGIDAFYLKNLLSRQYGRISTFDLFAHAENKWASIDKSLGRPVEYYKKFWAVMSRTFASRCSGEVLVLTGTEKEDDFYFGKNLELENLLKNEKVTSITEINIKYPELPARIIIPSNVNSRKTKIGIFNEKTNSILKSILAYKKNGIIVLDFGISEYHAKDKAYETLGDKVEKETVFLNIGKYLKKIYDELDDNYVIFGDEYSEWLNKAIENAVVEYENSQEAQKEQNNEIKTEIDFDVDDDVDKENKNISLPAFDSNQLVHNEENKNIKLELSTKFSTFDFIGKQDNKILFTSYGNHIADLSGSKQTPRHSIFDEIKGSNRMRPKQEGEGNDQQINDL